MKSSRDSRLGRPFLLVAIFLLAACLPAALAAPPVVSNVRAAQRPGTHLVDIYYNLAAIGPCTVYVAMSDNAGASWNVPVFTLTGAVGSGVTPGNDRLVVWNAGTDWPGRFNNQCRVRITADDGTAPPAPTGMVYIPAGTFQMGDSFLTDGSNNELPVHNVYLSAFFMDKFEVSRELWLDVHTWAIGHGYDFNNGGSFKAVTHPVHKISWYDAVKWCNARSEKEGLTPCYYTDATQTTIHRSGQNNLLNTSVKWNANGYRLPTEAEWEKGARGGLNGRRFPWGDTITHSQANYHSLPTSYAYDVSTTTGLHPIYNTGDNPKTSPVGSFAANGYGLHDMAGNLWEWMWDGYDSTYYGQPAATQDNPRGPAVASGVRVLRGTAWNTGAGDARCASRNSVPPNSFDHAFGFRCVRGL
ncbi:MAG: formylglycine-generating enzyme family protein [Verrucomicrobia bacterium]|nr:formylglycine-generating enzyme family protein [Verrucomicrobiota bacterium]